MAIRRAPEDFHVEELLDPSVSSRLLSAPAAYALYRLTKTSLGTPEAAAAIARRLGLEKGALAYAGLKDKHALSVQHVTLRLREPGADDGVEQAEGPGWKIERLGWLDAPLHSAAIAANRFRIVVRDLSAQACEEMDQAARLLASQPSDAAAAPVLRLINYFGDQRFGSARHGQGFLAKHLVRGEFEAALRLALAVSARKDRREVKAFKRAVAAGWGKWDELLPKLGRCPERRAIERLAQTRGDFREAFCALPYFFQQICVYAFQSHLWNAVARRMVAETCAPRGPVLAAEDIFGEMLFPSAEAIPEGWRELEVPFLGRRTELRDPWRSASEAVLAEEGLTLDQLRIPGVRRPFFGAEARRLCVEARNFALGVPEREGEAPGGPPSPRTVKAAPGRFRRAVSFDLPRGAYATVLLRALGQ